MDSGCLVIGGGSAVFLPSNSRSWLRAIRPPCDPIDTTASSNDVSVCDRANDTCFVLQQRIIHLRQQIRSVLTRTAPRGVATEDKGVEWLEMLPESFKFYER